MVLRGRLVAAAVAVVLCAGCSGNDEGRARPTPTPTTPRFTPAPAPTLDPAAALTQSVATKEFRPGFTMRLPADWTAIERDESAFQTYLGNEDFEITLDHTYRKRETVDQGVARLRAGSDLRAGPVEDVVVGGRRGKAFVAEFDAGVRFPDSTFHVQGGGPIMVMVVPVADGTTISGFLVTSDDRPATLPALHAISKRILATVRWT